MNQAILLSVLAVFAVGIVAAVLITYATSKAVLKMDAGWRDWHVKLSAEVKRLDAAIERTSNAKLAAELDALRGALDVNRASVRRELGSLWGRLGGRGHRATYVDAETGEAIDGDDEINAMLALQSAKPAGPSGNGRP